MIAAGCHPCIIKLVNFFLGQLHENLHSSDETPEEVVDSLIEQWAEHGLCAIAIIAPKVRDPALRRTVICRPSHLQQASDAIAQSEAYGDGWRVDDYSNVVQIDTSRDEPWLYEWRANGVIHLVRIAKDLPLGRQIEIYAGFTKPVEKQVLHALVSYVASSSARLRNKVLIPMSGLSDQQIKVLALSMTGMSAKDCAALMGLTERTINHHLTEVSLKLSSQNKIDSITRAIWLGVF